MLSRDLRLADLHRRAVEKGRGYPSRRDLFDELTRERGRHFTGIAGPRGVGKTVLLQQLADRDEHSFYLSADTLDGEDLFEVVQRLAESLQVRRFLIDEIHFSPDYPAALKRMYDFLDLQVVFTSSLSLSLLDSAQDLSRRVRVLRLPPFTLREYLAFRHGEALPVLSLEDIAARRWSRGHLLAASHLERYLRGGVMPFALEERDTLELLGNVLERIVHRDIPRVARLLIEETGAIERVVRFIGRSGVDGINYSSIARNLGITKYKAEAYVDLLERAFVLHRVLPAGTNVLREPKVLMTVPYRLLYRDYEDAIGGLREDFAAGMLRAAGLEVQYLKSTRGAKTPDLLVRTAGGKLAVEIGGRGKGRTRFKGIAVEHKLIFGHDIRTDGIRRPLHMLGFLA